MNRTRTLLVSLTLLALAGSAFAQGDPKVLRMVPHSNLVILDPIWTTAYMSRNHGYMIYDTLFGTDEKNQIKPQMVESWTESPDHRLWTFKLRKGLEFHDGKPVTSEDVTASLARWGKRDSMGAALMTFVERMDAPAADTFRIFLREPCGFVLEALGKPSSNVPFVMPKRVAETDPFKQIEDTTGSGPFIFKRDEFKPGDKAVYLRNPKYVPRKEAPSGSTGGKVVHFDRVEWNLAMRDPQTQVNALARGETDLIEQVAFDQYEAVKALKDVRVFFYTPLGRQFMARFNHLHKPFDNPAVRRAAIAAFTQEPFLRAQVGSKDLYSTCPSMFTCGTPYSNTAGSDIQAKSNLKKAQDLLKASGYDGTPVVLLKPTDIYSINKLPDVGAQVLRQAGFKVDLQVMDWQTMLSRRAKKDPIEKGGWSLIFAAWDSPDIWNPINNAALDARGEKSAGVGWPTDEKLEALRAQFLRETDDAKKKKLAEAIQARAFEIGTHAPIGEYRQPGAMAKSISGIVVGPGNFYWNVRKN